MGGQEPFGAISGKVKYVAGELHRVERVEGKVLLFTLFVVISSILMLSRISEIRVSIIGSSTQQAEYIIRPLE